MLKSFEKIESIDECRKIARLASLACFELQPDFENPDAQQLKDLKIASYLLSKITDRNGKILYGFYNVDYTDFLPLNTEETAFAYLEFFLGITVDTKTIEALKELLIADKASVIKSCQRNYDNYLPCKGWIFEQSASDLFIAVQNLFKEPIEQLWICDLSFSTYRLAEYIFFNKEGSRVRNYALFQQEEGKITFFFILKGKSQNIYDVWNENGFSIDTEEKYLDYLKFFTWAIEWNEGKFILPEKIHEMPWESIPPDKGSWNGIRSHLKSKNPQKYKEAGNKIEWDERIDKLKAQGGVIYGNAFFEAWFGINTANGFVRMPFDNALLGELPLKELKFHPQIAISVDEPGKEDAALSGNTFDKDSGTKEAQYTGFNDSECFKGLKNNDLISNQLFQKKLAVKGRVEKKRISKKITIADSIFKQSAVVCSERIEIWDCWFDEEVSLTNCSSGPSILFKNCVFAQKFSANDSFQPKSVSFENCLFNDLQDKKEGKQGVVIDFENYRSEGDLKFIDCCIMGEVLATTMKLSGDLVFKNCLMAHTHFLNKSGVTFQAIGSLVIKEHKLQEKEQWVVRTVKDKNHIWINEEKLFFAANSISDNPVLNIDNSFIKGNLEFSFGDDNKWTIAIGNVSAKGIEVRGETRFCGALVIGNFVFKSSTFHQDVRFSGDWFWSVVQFRNSLGYTDFSNCRITGSLYLTHADIENGINLYSMHVDAYVNLFALKIINGGINLNFSVVKGMVTAYHDPGDDVSSSYYYNSPFFGRDILFVGGDLSFSGAIVKSIRLEGIKVKGSIECTSGNFETLGISLGRAIFREKQNDVNFSVVHSEAQKISLTAIKVQGYVDLSGIRIVPKDPALQNAGGKKILPSNTDTCLIRSSHIGGDLCFFSAHNLLKSVLNPQEVQYYHSSINGSLNLETNIIEGYLDLRNTTVTEDIKLNDTNIRLSVDANRFYKYQPTSSETPGKINHGLKTVCKNLNMQKLQAGGNVYLSGLEASGNVMAEGAIVKGGMYFIADNAGNPYHEQESTTIRRNGKKTYLGTIGDALDLTAAEVNCVNFEKDNFIPVSQEKETKAARIILERGRFSKLTILAPVPAIDLRNVQVYDWNLSTSKEGHQRISLTAILNRYFWAALTFVLASYFAYYAYYNLHRTGMWESHLVGSVIGIVFILIGGLALSFLVHRKETKDANRYKQILDVMNPFEKGVYTEIEMKLRNEAREEDADEIYRSMRYKSSSESQLPYRIGDRLFKGFFTGYGTELIKMGILWCIILCWFAVFLSQPYHHIILNEGVSKENELPMHKALAVAFDYCIPFFDFRASNECKVAPDYSIYANITSLICFILLSLTGLSITSKLIRSK